MLTDRHDAYALLARLGAAPRLLTHLRLVGEAADELLAAYAGLGLRVDARLVELGVAVHDAGKIAHPSELDGPGSLHEPAGERLLLAHGVQPEVARFCVLHAAWDRPGLPLEALSVALADKLWKGKREPALELGVIDRVAAAMQLERWDVFERLDSAFEDIASRGDDRLARSRVA